MVLYTGFIAVRESQGKVREFDYGQGIREKSGNSVIFGKSQGIFDFLKTSGLRPDFTPTLLV